MKTLITLSATLLILPTLHAQVRPVNVLVIVADDLNANLACLGDKTAKTPNLDRLAARGVVFERAYCQFALCNPSRASFLSGRRPQTTGVLDQNATVRQKLPDVVFLPQFFRQHGWHTTGFGKVFHVPKMNDAASWDVYDDAASKDIEEIEALKRRYGNPPDKRTPDWMVMEGNGENMADGLTVRRAIEQMKADVKAGKKFFVAAGFKKPHLPWAVPKQYFDRYPAGAIAEPKEAAMQKVPAIALMTELTPSPAPASRLEAMRAYYASISYLDAQVGMLLDHLDEANLWDNTVVVFFGDNGFHLGDHGGLWSKWTTFEQAARVPLIIAAPGQAKGKTCSRPVELVDVYPTLVDLCKGENAKGTEGVSLAPLLRRPGADWQRPAYTTVVHKGVMGRSVRTPRHRYTEWDEGKQGVELYDHEADPGETRNVADDAAFGTTRAELSRLLRRVAN